MDDLETSYTERCQQELEAANGTPSRDDRILHLERALRFAMLSIEARKAEAPVSLIAWRARRASAKRDP